VRVGVDDLALADLVPLGADDDDVLAELRADVDAILLERLDRLRPSACTASSTFFANAWKASLFETGSVSQPTATIVPAASSIR
jgi:hypothetical protein